MSLSCPLPLPFVPSVATKLCQAPWSPRSRLAPRPADEALLREVGALDVTQLDEAELYYAESLPEAPEWSLRV